jgi:hypothetical protein
MNASPDNKIYSIPLFTRAKLDIIKRRDMTNTVQPEQFYTNQIESLQLTAEKLSKRSRFWVTLRLLSFLSIPTSIWLLYDKGPVVILVTIAALVLFLVFVRKSLENKEALNFVKNIIRINELELAALSGDHSGFSNGEEWIDPKHPYSYDMDIFGNNGIYQYLNRCVSKHGKTALARYLKGELNDQKLSYETIEELTQHMNWSQEFRASGMHSSSENVLNLSEWSNEKVVAPKTYKALRFMLPTVGWTLAILYYFDIIDGVVFTLASIPILLPVFSKLKDTNRMARKMEELEYTVKSLQAQNKLLNQLPAESTKLKELQVDAETASKELNKLAVICKRAGQRNNVLAGILLNYFFAWDLRIHVDTEKWLNDNHQSAKRWENNAIELEVYISAATFRYNQRACTSYPTVSNELSSIKIIGLGHPLIHAKNRVTNAFELSDEELFAILTGPNMAGKSTFLRSLGVNYVLAQCGFPVLASTFEAPALNLYTSMRNADDLSAETSYFHAELIRLRYITDAIEKRGEKVFIILDEILKGTNSKDKEEGSALFLQKLCELGARGIIATHDLKLTELGAEKTFIVNHYFDSTIDGEEMSFDYKIREGVAQNMNASFLLRKMGLTSQ